jgi:hypothetical protein
MRYAQPVPYYRVLLLALLHIILLLIKMDQENYVHQLEMILVLIT